jgi:hypothetical protein
MIPLTIIHLSSMHTKTNKRFSYWSNYGDKLLQRKDILPGHIFFLPKKIKKSWLNYHLIEDGCFNHPILIFRASEHADAVTLLTVVPRNSQLWEESTDLIRLHLSKGQGSKTGIHKIPRIVNVTSPFIPIHLILIMERYFILKGMANSPSVP